MRILLAPNAMKGSLSASQFAYAMEEGLLMANKEFECIKHPLADGGDGTAEVLIEALNGEFVTVEVSDPLGRKIKSRFGWIPATKTAVVEMADASGLRLLSLLELNPMIASSFGTGQLMLEAVKLGATKIILGIGGSATVDGGIGMLIALGFELTDIDGNEISEGGNGLNQLAHVYSNNVPKSILNCEITIASDVTNPLLGEKGTVRVYSAQKGATPTMMIKLEAGLQNYVKVLEEISKKELVNIVGGGAAGGISIPLLALLNARTVNGSDLIFDLLGIFDDLEKCDLVITGEGCIDLQTCYGKGPAAIAQEARKLGIPVIAIGGKVKSEASYLFDGIFSISNGPTTLEDAMKNAFELTKQVSFQLGKVISFSTHK
jgi:glycerate kinase